MKKKVIIIISAVVIITLVVIGTSFAGNKYTWDDFVRTYLIDSKDDKILAKVNDVNINQSAIDRCKIQQEIIPQENKTDYTDKDWIENQIALQILFMEAERLNLTSTEEEVSEWVKNEKDIYYNAKHNENISVFVSQIDSFCKIEGITPDEYFSKYA
jgi:hypothetical protein